VRRLALSYLDVDPARRACSLSMRKFSTPCWSWADTCGYQALDSVNTRRNRGTPTSALASMPSGTASTSPDRQRVGLDVQGGLSFATPGRSAQRNAGAVLYDVHGRYQGGSLRCAVSLRGAASVRDPRSFPVTAVVCS
jgi:hypothetical protein